MALLIEDAKTEAAIRRLADLRKVSVTDAAKAAAEEALQRDRRNLPVEERLAKIHALVRSLPDTGVELDKKFYDDLWGEDDLRGGEA
ncbi:MAG: type II toxin-antitoxin system VapB family antitoxin [Pseudomonadota bacterium]|nr:type II toxin-antitoxin system VapB family antitoxin [Pseudomonadota bacterium]